MNRNAIIPLRISTMFSCLRLSKSTSRRLTSKYSERRAKLMSSLPASAVVVLVGNPTTFATQKIFNPFQQNTDFLYMTGLDEPDCVAVLENLPNGQHRYTLFLEDRPHYEVRWSGPATGRELATSVFGADQAYPNSAFHPYFKQLQADKAKDRSAVMYLDPPASLVSGHLHPAHMTPSSGASHPTSSSGGSGGKPWWRAVISADAPPTRPISPLIQKMRAVKSVAEIEVMATAGRVSGESFAVAMAECPRLSTEHQLEAVLQYNFKMRGATDHAYVPVVAGGSNACILHYVNNDMQLNTGDLVLVDAGGQYGHYAADISRTFPINGRYTQPQRDLYQAVLNVQMECIDMISTSVSLDEVHHKSITLMTRELNALGFDVNEQVVARDLYFHHLGHFWLEPGTCVYVSADARFPSKYHGIGIRIEDNIVVTREGRRVLTTAAPKLVSDIESLTR
ncbi:peptidase M24, structural domain-containing protein [Catenaria anguillulae PL171]|uniref:Peptidase M24, structural domain-containing protein n=1 Tax=Catenaria anguillulae PL171 TaxID=765915 RepID=A0A1Y2HWT4_9FUNG|nr:peptidase M24, structural domain-containing protein [Catenaria anguillulae PL171]